MTALLVLFRREVALAWGRGGGPLLALGFYLAMATMFPLALAQGARLYDVAGAIAWVGLALASLISLDRLFERDFEDGGLDLLSLGGLPLEAVAAIKCLAQWLVTGAPLAIAAPIAAVALGVPAAVAPMILATAAVGGLAFAFLGGTGAALALASRRGGVLIAVIVLPLLIPPVIFGGQALHDFASGMAWTGSFALLAGYTLGAVALTPLAMAGACRNALS